MKNIYILYSCNEWKNHSNMSLIMASTSESKIRKEIKFQIKEGNMEYGADIKDLKQEELSYLNNCLKYGYIQLVTDGERQ